MASYKFSAATGCNFMRLKTGRFINKRGDIETGQQPKDMAAEKN